MPITTISGGISAFNNVILYPSRCIVPRLHNTPHTTTNSEINVALKLRKNMSRIIADKTKKYKTTIMVGLVLMSIGYLLLAIPTPTPVLPNV